MKYFYFFAFLFFSPLSFASFTCVPVDYRVVTQFPELPEANTDNTKRETICFLDESSQFVGSWQAFDQVRLYHFPYDLYNPYRIGTSHRSYSVDHFVWITNPNQDSFSSSSNISSVSLTPVAPNFSYADSVIDGLQSNNPDPEPDPDCSTGDCEPNLCSAFSGSTVDFFNQTTTYPTYCASPTPTAPVCQYFLSNVSGSTVTYSITESSDTCFSSGFVGNPTSIDDDPDTPIDPDPTDPTDPDPTDPTDPNSPPVRNPEMNWQNLSDGNFRTIGSILDYSSRVQDSINSKLSELNDNTEFNNTALNSIATAIQNLSTPNFDTQSLENAIQSQTNSLESSLTSTANSFLTNLGQLNADLSQSFQTGFQSLSNSIDDLHDSLTAVSSAVNPEEAKSIFTALIPSNEIDIMQYLDHYQTPYAASLRTCPAPISFELSIGTYEISLDFICQLAELLSYLLLALIALVCGRIIIS